MYNSRHGYECLGRIHSHLNWLYLGEQQLKEQWKSPKNLLELTEFIRDHIMDRVTRCLGGAEALEWADKNAVILPLYLVLEENRRLNLSTKSNHKGLPVCLIGYTYALREWYEENVGPDYEPEEVRRRLEHEVNVHSSVINGGNYVI